MTKTQISIPLTKTQTERLRAYSGRVTRALAELHQAQIGQQADRVGVLALAHADAQVKYEKALRTKGFAVGDMVTVVVRGRFTGRTVPVTEVTNREVYLNIDGTTVVANPNHIRMADADV